MSNAGNAYIVQPVMKALQVLNYVARQVHDVTLTEVVNEVKLPKTTVFRYLQTLSAASFLRHDRVRDRYGIGVGLQALAEGNHSLRRLRQIARPEMVALMQRFRETMNLAVLSDREIVYVEMVEPNRALRMHAKIGERHPVHSTALGKAIVAFLPDPAPYLRVEEDLPMRTIRTLTDVRSLRRQIAEVRQKGYAIEIGENEDGLMCIGVPILNGFGLPLAAMSLCAPERRMEAETMDEAIEALKGAAARISEKLVAMNRGEVDLCDALG